MLCHSLKNRIMRTFVSPPVSIIYFQQKPISRNWWLFTHFCQQPRINPCPGLIKHQQQIQSTAGAGRPCVDKQPQVSYVRGEIPMATREFDFIPNSGNGKKSIQIVNNTFRGTTGLVEMFDQRKYLQQISRKSLIETIHSLCSSSNGHSPQKER